MRLELHALCRAVRPLVVLPGQVFRREHRIALGVRQLIHIDRIDGRLRKYAPHGGGKRFIVHALHVVTVQYPYFLHRHAEVLREVRQLFLRLHVKAFFLFHK